jgi:hypothetical protein
MSRRNQQWLSAWAQRPSLSAEFGAVGDGGHAAGLCQDWAVQPLVCRDGRTSGVGSEVVRSVPREVGFNSDEVPMTITGSGMWVVGWSFAEGRTSCPT